MTAEIAFATAIDQARLVREREVSPVELVESYLERIEELNPRLGAYVTVAADAARTTAKEAEVALTASGEAELSPFHGVPISIKDLSETAGIRTTWGCRAFADRVPERDDEHVARIRRAGFVILGKTVVPELGPVNVSEPPGYPPGRNPWDTGRSCGGSSGGAAAALAAGLCPISQGSDGGGSIRNPSSWCGVFGLKPSRGRITSAPRMPEFFSVLGPISRSVADAAALLDVMSGPAPGDFFWAPPPTRPFLREVGADPGRRRVGYCARADDASIAVATAETEAVGDAAALLESLGHDVEEVEPPSVATELLPAMQAMFCATYAAREAAGDLPPLDTLTPWSRSMVEIGRGVTAAQYIDAQRTIQEACRRVVGFFDDHDLLLTPTVAAPPPPVGAYRDIDISRVAELWALTPFTGMWNTTGQPAASIPWSLDGEGLPVGVQLVAPPTGEALLLRVCSQVEEARPWGHWRPPPS